MILTVDIGNTTVAVAGYEGERQAFVGRLASDAIWDGVAWKAGLTELLPQGAGEPEGAALSSVVPALTGPVAQALTELTGRPALVVGHNASTGLDLGGYDPSSLGADRIVDCVAALSLCTGPVAVFDMGTATTLSVADGTGVFRGGMILPGVALGLEALSARTARLPAVRLAPPEGLLATDTQGCMRHGALYGAAGAVEGIIRRLERELGKVTVVLTGGNSALVYPLLEIPARWEPELTFLGLLRIWQRSEEEKNGRTALSGPSI